jgi:hypothetical protein
MKTRRKALTALCGLILLATIGYVFFSYPQWPSWQGRIMIQWLALLDKQMPAPQTLIGVRLYQWRTILDPDAAETPPSALELSTLGRNYGDVFYS